MSQTKHSVNHPFKRFLFLCLGLIIMAFGVAFSIQAALGTSPISSVPYVTSAISGLSVGTTTIIMNFIFILIQIAILRREYDWFQLLQLPAAILFGVMIDVAKICIQGITASNYFEQWILCAGYHRGRGHCPCNLSKGSHPLWQYEGYLRCDSGLYRCHLVLSFSWTPRWCTGRYHRCCSVCRSDYQTDQQTDKSYRTHLLTINFRFSLSPAHTGIK